MGERIVLDCVAVAPPAAVVERIVGILRAGGIVAAPSDTVYGFLGAAASKRAREALGRLKGREGGFIALVGEWEDAHRMTSGVSESLWSNLGRVWPGPVTAVLPCAPEVDWTGSRTVALRMPALPFLRSVLLTVGGPLLSTSANRPGEAPARSGAEVWTAFADEVDLVIDAGPSAGDRPSTVIDLTARPPRVLRAGAGDASPLLDRS